jgi:hypothetical protein
LNYSDIYSSYGWEVSTPAKQQLHSDISNYNDYSSNTDSERDSSSSKTYIHNPLRQLFPNETTSSSIPPSRQLSSVARVYQSLRPNRRNSLMMGTFTPTSSKKNTNTTVTFAAETSQKGNDLKKKSSIMDPHTRIRKLLQNIYMDTYELLLLLSVCYPVVVCFVVIISLLVLSGHFIIAKILGTIMATYVVMNGIS